MASADGQPLAAHLERSRAAHFAGRAAELARLRGALADPGPSLIFVHGPGGIGKTSLLEQFAAEARAGGHPVVAVDARDLGLDSEVAAAAIARAAGAPPATPPAQALAIGGGRPVLIVDTFEAIGGLEPWLRNQLLPSLVGAPLVVIAGRAPTSPAWRVDPAWHGTLSVVGLGSMALDESAELLSRRGVAADAHAALHEISHGHPLALALLAEIAVERRGTLPELSPDLVQTLLERFLRDLAAPHEDALAVCALARVTTESLLREIIGDQAPALYRWLRGLSFIELGRDGLFPHDLARDVVASDLAVRDPDRRRALVGRLRSAHIAALERASHEPDRLRAVRDLLFVGRRSRSLRSYVTWREGETGWGERAGPRDAEAVVGLIGSHEGPEAAALAQHWWRRQPSAFTVFRSADGDVAGLLVLLRLEGFAACDRDADPAIQAAARHAERAGPVGAGEVVIYNRFFGTRGAWQQVSPVQDLVQMTCITRWLTTPHLAWSYVAVRTPSIWAPQFDAVGMAASADAGFATDGVPQIVHVHDWRRTPAARWLLERGPDLASGADAGETSPLSDEVLTAAIAAALRDFTRAGALDASPLLGSAVVRRAAGAGRPTAETVRAVLRTVVDELALHPRDQKAAAVLDATYLRPAPSQEAAAERLDLPMGTYRRQLRRGLERVSEILCARERLGEATRGRGSRRE
jgi:hypothetical protein